MQESSQHCFYDAYWRSPDNASPEHDPDTRKRLRFLFETLNRVGSENRLILDAGCGTGLVTHEVHKAGHKILGIDICLRAIAKARSRYRDIQFAQGALDAIWPFDDEDFDVICSSGVREHFLHIPTYLGETNRALKRWVIHFHDSISRFVEESLDLMCAFERHFCNIRSGDIRFFSNRSLRNILEEFAFQVSYWRYYGRLWAIPKGEYMVAQEVHEVQNKESKEMRCAQG